MFDISPLRMCVFVTLLFFFFKQKTAYEMRISDWSSDVCSSDLAFERGADGADDLAHRLGERLCDLGLRHADLRRAAVDEVAALARHDHPAALRRDGPAARVLHAPSHERPVGTACVTPCSPPCSPSHPPHHPTPTPPHPPPPT